MSEPNSENIVFKILIVSEESRIIQPVANLLSSEQLKEQITKDFENREERFIFEAVAVKDTPEKALDKLKEFKPDFVIIDFSNLDLIDFGDLVNDLKISLYKPKEIIVINMDPIYNTEFSNLGWDLYLAYIDKGPDMYPTLLEALHYLWIRRHQYLS